MDRIGSLYDFIDPLKIKSKQFKTSIRQNIKQNKSIHQTPKIIFHQYQPSKKKFIIQSLQTNKINDEQSIDNWQHLMQKYKQKKFFLKHQLIQFPKKNKQLSQISSKNQFNINCGLLRAVSKMQQEDHRNPRKTRHEQTLTHYTQKLASLKTRPFLTQKKSSEQPQQQSNPSSLKKVRCKTSLSNKKRLQFEQCLSWTKKHNKIGKYYQIQLGKIQPQNLWFKQLSKRKLLLHHLHRKYQFHSHHTHYFSYQ